MQELHMPAHYARIEAQELPSITGGSEVGDAIGAFVDSLHLTDFYRGSSVLAISFTFVPALLFTAVRLVYSVSRELVEGLYNMFWQL